MERLLFQELIAWKEKTNRKPLILKGVRQCGKTYLLKTFGRQCYADTAYFNFEETESLKTLFETEYDVNRILFELGLTLGRTIQRETTLIIFDEIQECGRAITALKYFCENAPEYHIVCAGSLLGIALKKQPSFPVGTVDFLTLYPMSYAEFLLANGETQLAGYLAVFKRGGKISEPVANKLATYLKQYYVTGGMPEVVQMWCETHDIEKTEKVQQMILDSYQFDFSANCKCKLDTCTVEIRSSEHRTWWEPLASIVDDAVAAGGCVNRVEELFKQFFRGSVAQLLARASVQLVSGR